MFRRKLLSHIDARHKVYSLAVRWNWQGCLTKYFDRATGTYKYDNWDNVLAGSAEPTKKGQSLLQMHLRNERHIKPKEVKRRTNSRIIYDRKIKRIEDLTKYIKLMKSGPEEFNRDFRK